MGAVEVWLMATVDTTGKKIRAWVEARERRVRDDWDELIVATGAERSGKSRTVRTIARKIDPEFDPVKQVAYSGLEFERKALRLPKYKPIILDEAIEGGFGREALSAPNRSLVKHLTIAGDRNLIAFICWPGARFLDKHLREWRSTWNLHMERRWKEKAQVALRKFHEDETVYDPPRHFFSFYMPKLPKDNVDRVCDRMKRHAQEARQDTQYEEKQRLYHHLEDHTGPLIDGYIHELA